MDLHQNPNIDKIIQKPSKSSIFSQPLSVPSVVIKCPLSTLSTMFIPFKPMIPSILFILIWWVCAFYHFPIPSKPSIINSHSSFHLNHPILVSRPALIEALNGDTQQMATLMSHWNNVLNNLTFPHHANINTIHQFNEIYCDFLSKLETLNNHPDSSSSFSIPQILPQTYAAATILLALVPPNHIVAIPEGLRSPSHSPYLLSEKLSQIPHHIDRYNSEKFFILNPNMAFVSPYSNPNTVQALKNQNIPLVTLNESLTPNGIEQNIKLIGEQCGELAQLKSELLCLFQNGALMAFDMYLKYLVSSHPSLCQKTYVYLNVYAPHSNFYIVSKGSLSEYLILRIQSLGIGHWNVQLEQLEDAVPLEQILLIKPDQLILCSPQMHQGAIAAFLQRYPAFNFSFHFLDESVQTSPTQFIVLAYYDLCTSL